MTYIITTRGFLRTSSGAAIPQDFNNADYQQYLKWVAAGNVAEIESSPVSTKPDWVGFYTAFCASDLYDSLAELASTNPTVNLALVPVMSVLASALTGAKVGAAASITLNALGQTLIATGNAFTPEQIAERDALFAEYNLGSYFS